MRRLCVLCKRRRTCRTRGKYCRECYEEFVQGLGKIPLPDGHPFTEERKRRVERMRRRAALGLPIFEKVNPDLS
jgi:hypothetical protein